VTADWDTAIAILLVGWKGIGLAALCGFLMGPIDAAIRPGGVRQLAAGVVFGLAAVAAMMGTADLGRGLILDTRWAAVGFGAAFAGVPGMAVSAAFAGGYRLWLGGPGAAAAVLGLAISGGLGLWWRHRVANRAGRTALAKYALLGAVVSLHAVTFPFILVDHPEVVGLVTWLTMAPVYVAAAVLFGLVTSGQVTHDPPGAARWSEREA
jgi:hypothetical protein